MTKLRMMVLFYVGLSLCVGCYTPTETKQLRRWCSGETDSAKLVSCIERLTKAGNPMSDEEGEDLVLQAQLTCEKAVP